MPAAWNQQPGACPLETHGVVCSWIVHLRGLQVGSIEEAAAAFPKADVFVNFASFR